MKRKNFPETNPHICLAFLSCCGRTDLLNHTLAGAIRHLEEDEPDWLRYEIAWVDNGSGPEKTREILKSYQIEHALPLEQNTGLAMGMNLLIFHLCQNAPYILLLEEDWLYLDDVLVEQTVQRKQAIATAISLLELNITSFDFRPVAGVFLRPETYNSWLPFPLKDVWEQAQVPSIMGRRTDHAPTTTTTTTVNYQIFCADSALQTQYLWGSYTNGAGLYKRSAFEETGRMLGEPGDVFHDRYVESNYAYRFGLRYCHAAIQLGHCQDIGNKACTAAFHHIGGGRGTRPMKKEGTSCVHDMWSFVGTPLVQKMKRLPGWKEPCSREEMLQWRSVQQKEFDAAGYRQEVAEQYAIQSAKEQEKRQQMKFLASMLRAGQKEMLLQQGIAWLKDIADEDVEAFANRMERLADSPHPLEGFYDSHGRPIQQQQQ
jgi:hypothetical protein